MFYTDDGKGNTRLDEAIREELLDALERVGIKARANLDLSDMVWWALHHSDDWGLPAELRHRLTLSAVRLYRYEDGSILAMRDLLKDGDEEGTGIMMTLDGEFFGGWCS